MISDVIEFVTSPIFQIMFWGILTIAVYLSTLLKWVGGEILDDPGLDYRVIVSGITCLFWSANVIMWFLSIAYEMLVVDLLFTNIIAVIAWRKRCYWLFTLLYLCVISLILDIFYRQGMSYDWYSNLSNFVYTCQLLMMSGWYQPYVRRILFTNTSEHYKQEGLL